MPSSPSPSAVEPEANSEQEHMNPQPIGKIPDSDTAYFLSQQIIKPISKKLNPFKRKTGEGEYHHHEILTPAEQENFFEDLTKINPHYAETLRKKFRSIKDYSPYLEADFFLNMEIAVVAQPGIEANPMAKNHVQELMDQERFSDYWSNIEKRYAETLSQAREIMILPQLVEQVFQNLPPGMSADDLHKIVSPYFHDGEIKGNSFEEQRQSVTDILSRVEVLDQEIFAYQEAYMRAKIQMKELLGHLDDLNPKNPLRDRPYPYANLARYFFLKLVKAQELSEIQENMRMVDLVYQIAQRSKGMELLDPKLYNEELRSFAFDEMEQKVAQAISADNDDEIKKCVVEALRITEFIQHTHFLEEEGQLLTPIRKREMVQPMPGYFECPAKYVFEETADYNSPENIVDRILDCVSEKVIDPNTYGTLQLLFYVLQLAKQNQVMNLSQLLKSMPIDQVKVVEQYQAGSCYELTTVIIHHLKIEMQSLYQNDPEKQQQMIKLLDSCIFQTLSSQNQLPLVEYISQGQENKNKGAQNFTDRIHSGVKIPIKLTGAKSPSRIAYLIIDPLGPGMINKGLVLQGQEEEDASPYGFSEGALHYGSNMLDTRSDPDFQKKLFSISRFLKILVLFSSRKTMSHLQVKFAKKGKEPQIVFNHIHNAPGKNSIFAKSQTFSLLEVKKALQTPALREQMKSLLRAHIAKIEVANTEEVLEGLINVVEYYDQIEKLIPKSLLTEAR